MNFVTADTDIGLMDMLRLAISCLTGIGALALIAIVGIVGFICFVMWRDQQEPPKTEHAGIFTHEEALRLSAVKHCFTEMEERIIEDIPLFDETGEPIAPPPPPKEYDGPSLWRD